MFATPNYPDAVMDTQRKRARVDEEDLGHGSNGFSEHRSKRIQCLPLRTSPRGPHQWVPPAITPLNSDSEEAMRRSQAARWSPSQNGRGEVDMMHTQSCSDISNGRLPTPIQPSFAAQVRGQQCEWAGPGPIVKTLNGIVNMGHHQTGFTDDQFVPRAMAVEADWQAVQNNRRLPSPISEGDDCMANSPLNSPGMVLDTGYQDCARSDAVAAPLPSPSRVMEHPNAMMDVESRAAPESSDNEDDPSSPSPNRRGHIRSRHTVNNWTWQPGMKKAFSIGYRSDCEKCRLKVPGHFNHIVIS